MNKGRNIIYYSNHCETCRSLITILKSEGIYDTFDKKCVDDYIKNKQLHLLPKSFKRVPTMIIDGTDKIFEAEQTFEWVNYYRFMKQKAQEESEKKMALLNAVKTNLINQINKSNQPIGFVRSEMSNLSDNSAYLNIDMPMPHTYFEYASEEKNAIFTAPERPKINISDQKKRISQLSKLREDENKQVGEKLLNERVNAIIEEEKKKFLSEIQNEFNTK